MTQASERILDEATNWLLQLTEHPADDAVQTAFRQWLAADPQHEKVWKELNHSYELIGATQPDMADRWQDEPAMRPLRRRGFRRQDARRRHVASPGRFRRRRAIAAAVAAVLLAVWAGPSAWLMLQSDYRTGTGELETVRLPDGSSARLGPGSAIRIVYKAGTRRVDLIAGQALFEVEPDKDRPFRVVAGNVTATVLGTAFDVRRLGETTGVGVRHGRVRVASTASGNGPIVLEAGQRLSLNEAGAIRMDRLSPQLIAAWAHGEVNARDRTVAEVIDDIRPWYRGRIIIADEALAAKRVNGVFNPRDASHAIRSMVAPLGGSVTRITPWLIIVRG
ncbi:FecR family protein [Altericroceibacterium spongiae]|nr:FecR domain-containing protein [Altericroceibacterium spongiae]